MERPNDRIARRLSEIREQEAALDREATERQADATDPGTAMADPGTAMADPGTAVADRRNGGALRSTAFFIVVVAAAAGLLGLAVTFTRLAGKDFGDAHREGRAQVTSCVGHGPVSNKGFGYWESCTATITWDDGGVDRTTVGAVFRSSDIGTEVRVGDLGNYRTSRDLVRAGAPHRPWLSWIGYLVGIVAFVPVLIATLIMRGLFRRR
jgi:hypothetical protein